MEASLILSRAMGAGGSMRGLNRHTIISLPKSPYTSFPRQGLRNRRLISNIASSADGFGSGSSSIDFLKTLMQSFDNLKPRRTHMPINLFSRTVLEKLPPDGKILTPEQEFCDAYEEICSTPINVWECACPKCNGSGTFKSTWTPRSRGMRSGHGSRGRIGTCSVCSGLGFVRHVASGEDVDPSCDVSAGPPGFTLIRPEQSEYKKPERIEFWK